MFFCGQRRENWSGGLIVQPYLQTPPTPSLSQTMYAFSPCLRAGGSWKYSDNWPQRWISSTIITNFSHKRLSAWMDSYYTCPQVWGASLAQPENWWNHRYVPDVCSLNGFDKQKVRSWEADVERSPLVHCQRQSSLALVINAPLCCPIVINTPLSSFLAHMERIIQQKTGGGMASVYHMKGACSSH